MINMREWCVLTQLTYNGVTYGRGEQLPAMSEEDLLGFEAKGVLVRVRPDGTMTPPPTSPTPPAPATAEEYLRARDDIVLRHILKYRPKATLLVEMERLARFSKRSQTLVLALVIAQGASEVEAEEPAGSEEGGDRATANSLG